ncbi:MAG TPA: sigma-70 family RNA polymerase sigma factor [Candidatus Baltobacteraceae bacterium]|nr:sigma-70 family RNA polymerase sigma factor [Candidatus Baltobacteraceae bacterium]
MSSPTRSSVVHLALLDSAATLLAGDSPASDVQCEVMHLFDEYRDKLLRYAISFGIGVEDGEDVIQEVFLALFRHLCAGRSREHLRGWIFRVTHNLALKQRGARSKQRIRSSSDDLVIEAQFDPEANPEERMSASQQQHRLVCAFNALPERDRWCLSLRAEGLRYREIADALGMSLGAVSNSLARSLARLARADEL